jgi:hypothetical protein
MCGIFLLSTSLSSTFSKLGARHRYSVPPRQDELPGRYGMRVARVFLMVPPETTAETSPLPGAVPRTFPPLSSACTVH